MHARPVAPGACPARHVRDARGLSYSEVLALEMRAERSGFLLRLRAPLSASMQQDSAPVRVRNAARIRRPFWPAPRRRDGVRGQSGSSPWQAGGYRRSVSPARPSGATARQLSRSSGRTSPWAMRPANIGRSIRMRLRS